MKDSGSTSVPTSSPSSRQILASLRQEIISKTYPPESRLPTRRELAVNFNSNLVTVQRALEQLRRDGFVTPRGKRGTFVNKTLPHLTRFTIAFGTHNPGERSSFYSALLHAVAQLPPMADGRSLSVFHGIEHKADPEQYDQFVNEAAARRLSGVILLIHPNLMAQTPVISPELPRVCITSLPALNTPAVFPDYTSFFNRALDHLAARSRKRIAILTLTSGYETTLHSHMDAISAGLRARGMSTEPFWNLPLPPNKLTIKNVTQLLMRPGHAPIPDGLIIADDHLVSAVSDGLKAAGHTTNDHLDVVAASNFPIPPSTVTPVKRLGFDARQIINTCLNILDAQREGKTVQELTLVPAVFEDEIK